MMQKKSNDFFSYPPNLQMLDLASMVGMYRMRGEPRRAPSGEYFACCRSRKLIKEAKYWFGLFYSQSAWDQLLTKDSGGYPLTQIEFSVMGFCVYPPEENNHRSAIESHTGFIPQLTFLIVNDLKQFGFIQEYDNGLLAITNTGQKALEGFAKRVYEARFSADMLALDHREYARPGLEQAKKKDPVQTRLF